MGSGNDGGRFMTEEGPGDSLSYGGEIWRKILHLVSITIPVGLLLLGRTTALYILVPLAALFLIAEIARRLSPAIRRLIRSTFGFMMRPQEISDAPTPVQFNGATWVLISACVVIALFEPRVAAAGLVIGLIGDAAAALVGRRFGRHHFGRSGKTFEGTISFILAALIAVLFVPGMKIPNAIAAVVIAALVEGIGTPLNDNLSVPLSACIVLTLL